MTLAIIYAAPDANKKPSTTINARIAAASSIYVFLINEALSAGSAFAAELLPNVDEKSFINSLWILDCGYRNLFARIRN
jgi:hypothetical protein